MIVELVQFTHPEALTPEQARAEALLTVPRWQSDPDLVRKLYLLGLDGRAAAGVYVWPSIEAARRAHDAHWIASTEMRTGQAVRISHYELLMTLDRQRPNVGEGADG